ncbi:MAG: hypothetical protein ABIA78_00710 [archaeon]
MKTKDLIQKSLKENPKDVAEYIQRLNETSVHGKGEISRRREIISSITDALKEHYDFVDDSESSSVIGLVPTEYGYNGEPGDVLDRRKMYYFLLEMD